MHIENLISQLKILESIQNPTQYIIEAISKIKKDINFYKLKKKEELTLSEINNKIEKLKKEYPNFEIIYSVKTKVLQQLPDLEKENISILTHINALNKDYTYKEPRAIIFRNRSYGAIKYWKDVLEKVCNLMQELHPSEIDKIKQIRGPNRIYFTNQLNQLNSPEAKLNPRKIKNTNIYIETHWSANAHVNLCYKVIEIFGYKRSELSFITK